MPIERVNESVTVERSTEPNLAALLIEHPCADADLLLHEPDRSMTAGEARRRAASIAADLGDVEGHAVAVKLPDGCELVATMFGVWLAGGVLVPVNVRHPEAEVAHVLEASEPCALIDETGISRRGEGARYQAGTAFVTWTSGTTGRPKPILHTHAGYLELIDRVLSRLKGGGGSRPAPNLVPVSMALNAGLYNVLFGLRAGAELVIMGRFDPIDFARLVDRFQIRSTVLPPAAMTMLNDSAVETLEPLRYVRSITAPLSPLQARRFRDRFGVLVLNGYGQAELGEVIGWTVADAKAFPEKIGAAGRPHPGVEVRLADDGRLLIRSSSAATGIDDRRDEDGFLDTGDLARIDSDGFVWIEGRSSDLIIRGGNKVFPDAVEEVLKTCDAVDDAAVVGAPDDRLGEVPVAFLVGRPVPDEQLEALCREHLVPYKVPVAFHWVDRLPRSEVGKLLRRELVDSLARPAAPPAD